MHALLAQGTDPLETAKAIGGLPTSAVLALVVVALVWWIMKLDAKHDAALVANDKLQDERVADLKQTIRDLGGSSHKESAA